MDASLGNTAAGGPLSDSPVSGPAQSPIEISVFVPRTATDPPQPAVPAQRPLRILRFPQGQVLCALCRRALPSALCAIATILVHAILFAPFLDGIAGASGGAGLHANRRGSDRLEVRIIEEQDTASSASLQQHLVQPVLTPISLNLPLEADPPPLQAAIPGAAATEVHLAQGSAGPAAARSYLRQINDLIDRAWLRPQIAIGAPEFACHVRIDQNLSGQIENIIFGQCNRNVRWRLSLITAIRSASPLPAPADPSQFRSTLHIVFKSRSLPGRG